MLAVPDGLAPRQIPKRRALPNYNDYIENRRSVCEHRAAFSWRGCPNPHNSTTRPLTLSSANAVMTADVVNATTIYYLSYPGNGMPMRQYFGGVINAYLYYPVAPQTLNLNSSQQTAGTIHDIFAFFSGSSTAIGVGPAWASSTSRGTGSGSTAIQRDSTLLVWMNTNAITVYNGTTSYNIGAGYGTYLGSVYMTGNGETSMQFKPTPAPGGTAGQNLGLYNAYNRVRTIASNNDSTSAGWTYSTAAWEALDDSTNNSIGFLDGLQQSSVDAQAQINVSASSSSVSGWIAVDLDSFTANPGGTRAGVRVHQPPTGQVFLRSTISSLN